MKPTKTDNLLANQHNHLIRTPLRMGLVEARIFVHALAHIHLHADALPPIRVPLTSITGKNPNGEDYANIRKACLDLAAQHVKVESVQVAGTKARRRRPDLHIINIISDLELNTGTGMITGSFNPKVRPYLLQLTETGNFTSANIQTLLTFTNPNSARLYWILLSYRNLDSPTHTVVKQLELDELKAWMLADASLYPLFAEFNRWVLQPVAEDFARIGFGATWEPVRTGKKITALKFTIPKEKPEPKKLAAAAASAAAPVAEKATAFTEWLAGTNNEKLTNHYNRLREQNKLTATQAQKVIRYIHQHPDKAADFYATRHRIMKHNKPIADMRSFTLAALNATLGTDFK